VGVKLFEDWQTAIVRPVLVSVLTAGTIFALALVFKPQVYRLFVRPEVSYPLFCTAEPHPGDGPGRLHVEFFIVNRVDESFDRAKLLDLLRPQSPDPVHPLRPDIELQIAPDSPARFVSVAGHERFNDRRKGLVVAEVEAGRVRLLVREIGPRAVFWFTIVIEGLRHVEADMSPMARSTIPVRDHAYLERCYAGW
jgi:hypothetical protein